VQLSERGLVEPLDHCELHAVAQPAAMRLPQLGPCGAEQPEIGERHARLLAELEQREAHVDVRWHRLGRHFVKHAPRAMTVAFLAKVPRELRLQVRWPDWIAHGNPAATAHLVHHEGIGAFVQQESLVAEQRQRGRGRPGVLQRVHDARLVRFERGFGRRMPWRQQVQQHECDGEHRHDERRAQHARGMRVERERPPQLV
jgi:hypothetical protein